MQNLQELLGLNIHVGAWEQNQNLWHLHGDIVEALQGRGLAPPASPPNDRLATPEQLKLERRKELSCPYKKFIETGDLEDDSLFIDTTAVEEMIQVVAGLKESDGFLGNLVGWVNGSVPSSP